MNFEDALKEIEKEYQVKRMYNGYAQIELDELFDAFNYMFIGIVDREGKIFLTDNADYAELVDYDRHEKEINELVKKHHLTIDDYHIVKEYSSNKDVKDYLEFLYDLREKFAD